MEEGDRPRWEPVAAPPVATWTGEYAVNLDVADLSPGEDAKPNPPAERMYACRRLSQGAPNDEAADDFIAVALGRALAVDSAELLRGSNCSAAVPKPRLRVFAAE